MNRLLLILFISIGFHSIAQVPYFQSYNLLSKRENLNVNAMIQDHAGFLWLATERGLFRFDGKNHTVYTLPDSIGNNITAVEPDSLDRIWVGLESGKLAYLDHGSFKLFETAEGNATAPISDIIFDRKGILWFATRNDGLYYYVDNRLHRIDETDGMPDTYIYDIIEDHDGNILAGTDRGLAICKLIDKKVTVEVITYKTGLPDNIVKKLDFDKHRQLWIATEDAGIARLDLQSKQSFPLVPSWSHGSIQDFCIRGDQFWISCPMTGLVRVDVSTGAEHVYENRIVKGASSINSLFEDREGNIWACSKSGLFRTPGELLTFIRDFQNEQDNNVLAVTADHDNNVWYSSHKGLFKRILFSGGQAHLEEPLKATAFSRHTVISLYTDKNGYIWAGLYGEGALRIDPKTFEVRHFTTGLRNGNVLNITGKENIVWLATLGGGSRVDIDQKELKVENFSTTEGLSSDFIYHVFIDSKNRVWFATDGKGVDMMDGKGFHHFTAGLPAQVVYGLAEDSTGKIWANVQGHGISYFDEQSSFVKAPSFATIRDQEIHVLTSDKYGNILLVHDLGLDLLDPKKKSIRYLAEQNGIREHYGNLNAIGKDVHGNLLIGTSDGIIIYAGLNNFFDSKPSPQIETIWIYDQSIARERLRSLNHDQDNISIHYTGLWYQDPENVFFSYRLDNYDNDWISTKNGSVTYSKLPPGKYLFRVRASVNENFDEAAETTLAFVINPPFWKTPPFYMLLVAFFIVTGYSIVKYREKKLRYDNLVLEARVKRRTMEVQRQNEEIQAQNEEIIAQAEEIRGINENLEMLVKQRTFELEHKNKALEEYAFINAHKLRSPLASILGLTHLIGKTQLDSEGKEISQRLQKAADDLDEIVRSITKTIEKSERQYPLDEILKEPGDKAG
jgi:ligand-binding sensor domain-containing protein